MVEQLMKAVKRGNKKRSINITIGAVVGFLLSCTAVMGAADNYLWIKEDGGTIKFSTDTTNGADGEWNERNPYEENNWDADTKTYVNNIIISGKENEKSSEFNEKNRIKDGYGIKLEANISNFINNNKISGSATATSGYNTKSYGIYVNSKTIIENLKNRGVICAGAVGMNSVNSRSYGIYIDSQATIKNLENTGHIAGNINPDSLGYGIYAEGIIENLINTGIIRTGVNGSEGIHISSGITKKLENMGNITDANIGILAAGGIIENLKNVGTISAIFASTGQAIGVFMSGNIERLENTGTLISSRTGIYVRESKGNLGGISEILNQGKIDSKGEYAKGVVIELYGKIDNFNNTGIIYGEDFAVYMNDVPIYSTNNYGIFAGNKIIENEKKLPVKNYGLYIEGKDGIVTEGDQTIKGTDEKVMLTTGYDENGNELKREMVVRNAVIIDGSGIGTTTESIELGMNNYNNYILNGKNDTLKVSVTENEVKGSLINAYGSAVKFDTGGGELILSGTIVNGGIDGTAAISGSEEKDTLILQSGEVNYTNGTINTQNTIVNGNINMGAGADNLVINNGTIVNGILDGGDASSKDTLNLGVKSKEKSLSTAKEEINVHNNITNFENININTNVTLFEKTIKNQDLEITGVENITIGKDGILTLRIDGTNNNKHALSTGNSSGTIDSNGGKLLLAINGVSDGSTINIGMNLGDGIYGVENKDIKYSDLFTLETTSLLHSLEKTGSNELKVTTKSQLPLSSDTPETDTLDRVRYEKLNKIYQSMRNIDGVKEFNIETQENLSAFTEYLNDIYAGNPYSYSSELSRKSMGMFRDIVNENSFKPETNKWIVYGGLTHIDGGTRDTYYGKGYYTYDIGSSDMDADTKITGAYMLGEYGVSDTLTSGVVIGGNKLKSDLSNGSKVEGNAMYIGGYTKKYVGNLKVTAGAGLQYGDYDVDRLAAGKGITEIRNYSSNYDDMTYDIYLNGRYSHSIGDNLFLEPYGTLSYTYIDQDGADEGNKVLAIETDSKSFDYTTAKIGIDVKKVISHENGKSTLSAGVSYTRLLNGADEEYITGRFKCGSDFDILVAHKNEHSLGLNIKYTLELENGVLFDVKGNYAVERDSYNGTGKNKTKGEWIIGAGMGYKF